MNSSNTSNTTRAKLGSRLLAIIYDSLIVLFIIVVCIALIQLIAAKGEPIPAHHWINQLLKSFWFLISFAYFAGYWMKRGQTPGMRVWKVKVVALENDKLSLLQAGLRYFFAFFGMGLLWMIFDTEHLPLQDRISHTRLVKT